jgi:hypothetical protein
VIALVSSPQAGAPPVSSSAPITTFQAQEGAPIPEQHSGVRLLVTAYIVIWVIAMVFVQLTWLRQRSLARKVESLERTLDKKLEGGGDDDDDDDRSAKTIVKSFPKREQD